MKLYERICKNGNRCEKYYNHPWKSHYDGGSRILSFLFIKMYLILQNNRLKEQKFFNSGQKNT